MQAKYRDIWFLKGEEIQGDDKNVNLPFGRISARAMVVRRKDGAILGTLHHEGAKLAPPGGAVDDGESPDQAVERELAEENIQLINSSDTWRTRFDVSYFDGYKELSIWYIFDVEDAEIGECEENIFSRWVSQDEDVWYPGLREQMLLMIKSNLSEFLRKDLVIV